MVRGFAGASGAENVFVVLYSALNKRVHLAAYASACTGGLVRDRGAAVHPGSETLI